MNLYEIPYDFKHVGLLRSDINDFFFFVVESPKTVGNVVKLNMRLQEEVPVPKSRRVLPEHEGGYKITMPSGTTAKTQKILEQGLPAGRLTENTKCLPLKYVKTIYFPSPFICRLQMELQ